MRKIAALMLVLVLCGSVISCKKTKEMTSEDFIKIETEFLSGDMTDESRSAIAKKYGYTSEQYTTFENKVESDIELKTKVGEIRLKNQK